MTQLLAPIDWAFWIPRIAWFIFGGAVGALSVTLFALREMDKRKAVPRG